MLAKIKTQVVVGLDAHYVDVEVDISNGLPNFSIVGLPDTAVKESKDRVKAALKNCGFNLPSKRITVNLAPANLKKEGGSFDLPIAISLLVASGYIDPTSCRDKIFCGELSLDGQVRAVNGVLPMALGLSKNGFKNLVLPKENALEAQVVENINIFPVANLSEAFKFLKGELEIKLEKNGQKDNLFEPVKHEVDFCEVKGQWQAKRALEVAAAGGHNVLMIGPPGSGKTMLAHRLSTIIPDMSLEEALETTKIYSVCGLLHHKKYLINQRPFRSPHHTISSAGLVGGGPYPKPGEISLAHNGVLFLDELPELRRDALEALRQPLEEGLVTISRARSSFTYPSRFMLVAAMNPCPCGFLTDPKKQCHCTPPQIQRYLSKISGPLLDRIDIHIDVPALNYKELTSKTGIETSSQIKQRVEFAKQYQRQRFCQSKFHTNAQMPVKYMEKFCPLDKEAQDFLKMAILELGLSARAYDKVLKISRTIADLAGEEIIKSDHISEAINYRSLDRNWWGG